jgi:hypothetical protein
MLDFFFDPRKNCIPQSNARQHDWSHTKHSARKDRPRIELRHSRQGDVTDLNILVAPLVEELDLALVGEDILGKGGEGRNLDVPVVGHVDCVEGEWKGTGFGDGRLNDQSVETTQVKLEVRSLSPVVGVM